MYILYMYATCTYSIVFYSIPRALLYFSPVFPPHQNSNLAAVTSNVLQKIGQLCLRCSPKIAGVFAPSKKITKNLVDKQKGYLES